MRWVSLVWAHGTHQQVTDACRTVVIGVPPGQLQALWQRACAAVIPLEDEARFEVSVLAMCSHAWWLDQRSAMTQWLVLNPERSAAGLARFMGSPGTYTDQGRDQLQASAAH